MGAIIEIWLQLQDGAEEYSRSLDLKTGTAATKFNGAGHPYHIVAAPHEYLPQANLKIETDAPEGIVARVRLYRPNDARFEKPTVRGDESTLGLSLTFPERISLDLEMKIQGAQFCDVNLNDHIAPQHGGHLGKQYSVSHPDMENHANAEGILRGGSHEIDFTLQALVRADDVQGAKIEVRSDSSGAAQKYFHRYLSQAEVSLTGGNADDIDAPRHYEKLWNIGRYLFLAASRPDAWPPNLQGIWNDKTHPICNSDWHLDLNLQMAMWPLPTGNLLEFHEPFFRLVEQLVLGARRNAECLFEMRGIAFPACTYGHGEGRKYLDAWPSTSGWLMQHYWKHWLYTRDREFLRDRCYPLLREVALFYCDYLIEDGGRYVVMPSVSPENRIPERDNMFYGINATFDLAIIREVFSHLLEAARVLEVDEPLLAEVREKFAKLAKYSRTSEGRLREMEDYEFQKGHRHLSHLYPLFPGDEITPDTPELFHAAELALQHFESWPSTGSVDWFARPGYGAWAGWTYPWLACCHARLGQGDEALAVLRRYSKAFRCDGGLGLCFEKEDWGFGIHASPDIGKWIEIDAPCGTVAAIQEMLLQSHGGVLRLLPALPSTWRQGSFKGLRAEGGFEVDAQWHERKLQQATLRSSCGGVLHLSVSNEKVVIRGENNQTIRAVRERDSLSFETLRGVSYEVSCND